MIKRTIVSAPNPAARVLDFEAALAAAEARASAAEAERGAISVAKMELAARLEALELETRAAAALQARCESLTRRLRDAAADRERLAGRHARNLRIISGLSARLGELEDAWRDRDDDERRYQAGKEFDADLATGGGA